MKLNPATAGPAGVTLDRRRPRYGRRQRKRFMWAYLFVLPQFVFFIAFTIYPIVMSYVYSLFNWSGIGPLKRFVGWDNYVRVLQDERFWNAFQNTFIYVAGTTVILLPTTLLMAVVLNRGLQKGKVLYRVIYFLPVITTTAIVGLIMRSIFGNKNALFNELLMAIGLLDAPYPWLTRASSAMVIVILVGAWKFFGMMMVYWLAGLQSLPSDVYEAASIDGCGPVQSFRYITVPLLLPIGAVILLLSVVSGLHVFDLVKTLTEGGPYYGTDVMDLYIYRYAFDSGGPPAFGFASAAGIVFGLSILAITLIIGGLIRMTKSISG